MLFLAFDITVTKPQFPFSFWLVKVLLMSQAVHFCSTVRIMPQNLC